MYQNRLAFKMWDKCLTDTYMVEENLKKTETKTGTRSPFISNRNANQIHSSLYHLTAWGPCKKIIAKQINQILETYE